MTGWPRPKSLAPPALHIPLGRCKLRCAARGAGGRTSGRDAPTTAAGDTGAGAEAGAGVDIGVTDVCSVKHGSGGRAARRSVQRSATSVRDRKAAFAASPLVEGVWASKRRAVCYVWVQVVSVEQRGARALESLAACVLACLLPLHGGLEGPFLNLPFRCPLPAHSTTTPARPLLESSSTSLLV